MASVSRERVCIILKQTVFIVRPDRDEQCDNKYMHTITTVGARVSVVFFGTDGEKGPREPYYEP